MHLHHVSQQQRDVVQRALQATFNTTAVDLQLLTGGVSGAQIFRFEVRSRSYVLRVEPDRVALSDQERGFACMTAAAKAGAAPPVHFADAATGVAIMDFIAGRPLSDHPGGPLGLVRALGALIAKVQQTPPFPSLGDYLESLGGMLGRLTQSGIFAPGGLDPHAAGLARMRAALPWDAATLVSCHNDPNPRNMIFDGERVWLIDWELAFRNHPLVDVAILTTELAQTPALERALLEATFGAPPDRPLIARLAVIRLLTRLFYGCVVLDSLGDAVRSGLRTSEPALTPEAFRTALAEGRLASGAPETAYAFGRMSLRAFIEGVSEPGFEETLAMVKQG
jgi:aminoglycoside phosphotransferase (APT) family kinase protein